MAITRNAYITTGEYTDVFPNENCEEREIFEASELIDSIVLPNKIVKNSSNEYSNNVKLATAYQVKFAKNNGNPDGGSSGVYSSLSLGSLSVSFNNNQNQSDGVDVSQMAISYLEKDGLLYGGVCAN